MIRPVNNHIQFNYPYLIMSIIGWGQVESDIPLTNRLGSNQQKFDPDPSSNSRTGQSG